MAINIEVIPPGATGPTTGPIDPLNGTTNVWALPAIAGARSFHSALRHNTVIIRRWPTAIADAALHKAKSALHPGFLAP
jgi:hypothetical protein